MNHGPQIKMASRNNDYDQVTKVKCDKQPHL